MGEPLHRGNHHSQRLDDALARNPAEADEAADVGLWDSPGRDGVISDAESDPDRTDLRSRIGQYVSLVTFPAEVRELVAVAERNNAPDDVSAELRRLDPSTRLANTTELWAALDLASDHRF
jgi:Protein of unknown function (DUF2795)